MVTISYICRKFIKDMEFNIKAAYRALIGRRPSKSQRANCPCYDKDGNFIGWYSRSVAASIFVFCKDEIGRYCVLASERGQEAADYQGYWNCPCGYLDFNETTAQCAQRELLEECGVYVDPDSLDFIGFEDDPNSNRQNITFRYGCLIKDKITSSFTFSKDKNEGMEVGDIRWIPLEQIIHYKWAFGHFVRILEIAERYGILDIAIEKMHVED